MAGLWQEGIDERQKRMNPFAPHNPPNNEEKWVREAQAGSKEALEKLVRFHQRFIFNIALKYVRNPEDAADLAQEALIKMVTKLHQFKGKSKFRTWLYKIVTNHFINARARTAENEVTSFEQYGDFLEHIHVADDLTEDEKHQFDSAVAETRNRCMSSMLLCLDRSQRMVFVLCAIFGVKSSEGAALLGISADNFRQQLSRAKQDLFEFMDNKCGLVNPANPCRCSKKAKGFIKEGKIDPQTLSFNVKHQQQIEAEAADRNDQLDRLIDQKYLAFFRQQPYHDKDVTSKLMQSLLLDDDLKKVFHLN